MTEAPTAKAERRPTPFWGEVQGMDTSSRSGWLVFISINNGTKTFKVHWEG